MRLEIVQELGWGAGLLHKMLSLNSLDGLNRWWVWRGRLASTDFCKDELRLRLSRFHFAHEAKAAAVERSKPERLDRAAVVRRRVAAIMLPTIAGILARPLSHHPVARHLGND